MKKVFFMLFMLVGVTAMAFANLQLAQQYGCMACHAVDKKLIGPAYQDIATKYANKKSLSILRDKVINGGAGVWGPIPMTPHPQFKDKTKAADLDTLVKWILAQKKK